MSKQSRMKMFDSSTLTCLVAFQISNIVELGEHKFTLVLNPAHGYSLVPVQKIKCESFSA